MSTSREYRTSRPEMFSDHSVSHLRYDKLVIACGSTSATHGVPGLENCFQLKTISDAQKIRKRIIGELPLYSHYV